MDKSNIIESGGFYFIHNFDSGNLGNVERVPTDQIATNYVIKGSTSEIPDYEFNLWTRPDCAGTEFENQNRTWFYFGIQATVPNALVKLNLLNLNKQTKMYNQGMAPVTRTLPGKPQWERIRDRPVHSTDENAFTLSFKYRTSDNVKATTFFAFTYPYSFAELQIALNSIDMRMLPLPPSQTQDDIYYYRECLIYSLEGRRVDLLTISSHHGITSEREEKLQHLFPDNTDRPFKFKNKKVIFMSARVHPGETPSSFVFNGFLNLLLTRHDPVAIHLRRLYVFKMIPFLNPDGVARGHYRTDTRGVNLNRVYLNPSRIYHPTIYAARALIRYYHYGCEVEDSEDTKIFSSRSIQNMSECSELVDKMVDTSKKPRNQGSMTSSSTRSEYPALKSKRVRSAKDKGTFKGLSVEAATLAEQVCDLKLQESDKSFVAKESKATVCETASVLNDNVLRSCLGSEVHVSTSEELNIAGTNPLRPLRQALKDSISLLMEGNSLAGDNNSLNSKDSVGRNVRMGKCKECRSAAKSIASGQSPQTPQKYCDSIQEYREHQRVQYEQMERTVQECQGENETVYFCTNCFKRYSLTGPDEAQGKVEKAAAESGSATSMSGSAGDSGSNPSERDTAQPGSTGDALHTQHTGKKPRSKRSPMVPKIVTESGSVTSNTKKDKPAQDTSRMRRKATSAQNKTPSCLTDVDSGLFLYIDLHGHASKKGIFMYGNHFEDLENSVECMLLPRIMSLNNMHFHFSSCNFTERNMYLKDRRDGMSREGSGRVAVLKATGLVRSYTLECNYNTGRMVNVLPPKSLDPPGAERPPAPVPPKFTPHIYEEGRLRRSNLEVFEEMNAYEVGKSLASSILDLTGQHPNSRIPNSDHHTLASLREWLRAHTRSMRPQVAMSRYRGRPPSPGRAPLYARGKPKPAIDERKENVHDAKRAPAPPSSATASTGTATAGGSLARVDLVNVRLAQTARSTSRTKYLADTEPRPKSLSGKRRNVLALRKQSSTKNHVSGVVKPKRYESPSKLSARALASRRTTASSSSSSESGWGRGVSLLTPADALKRRPFPVAPPAAQLKKIRLKSTL